MPSLPASSDPLPLIFEHGGVTYAAIDDLATQASMAERLGVSRDMPSRWSTWDSFPKPLMRLGRIAVYSWSQVEAWHSNYVTRKPTGGRRTGEESARAQVSRTGKLVRTPEMCTWTAGCTNKKFRNHPFCQRHWYLWTDTGSGKRS